MATLIDTNRHKSTLFSTKLYNLMLPWKRIQRNRTKWGDNNGHLSMYIYVYMCTYINIYMDSELEREARWRQIEILVKFWHPHYEIFASPKGLCSDLNSFRVAQLQGQSITRGADILHLNNHDGIRAELECRCTKRNSVGTEIYRDNAFTMISWNTRKRCVKRMRLIMRFFSQYHVAAFIGFQVVPKG